MKIYITGLASGYEVEHLVRLFYPMAPLTLTPPEAGEDCVWAERKPDGLLALVREHGGQEAVSAPLPGPDGETEAFALASLTYDLLRRWTGIRPPWGKMTGVRPVRLIHDKRAAGWSEAEIDRFFLSRFDCSEQKYQMARAIADLQEPILRLGSEPKTYSLYIGIPFCPSRCSYCSFVSCNLDRDRKLVQPYVDCPVQLTQHGAKMSLAQQLVGPHPVGSLLPRRKPGGIHPFRGEFRVPVQKRRYGLLVLLRREGAGGIDQASAGL